MVTLSMNVKVKRMNNGIFALSIAHIEEKDYGVGAGAIILGDAELAKKNIDLYLSSEDKSVWRLPLTGGSHGDKLFEFLVPPDSTYELAAVLLDGLTLIEESTKPVRVMAIIEDKKDSITVLGMGNMVGDHPCEYLGGRANPKIILDTGEVAWGCMCWWGPASEEDLDKRCEGKTVKVITVAEYLKGVEESRKAAQSPEGRIEGLRNHIRSYEASLEAARKQLAALEAVAGPVPEMSGVVTA